jgi:hypothetical protein
MRPISPAAATAFERVRRVDLAGVAIVVAAPAVALAAVLRERPELPWLALTPCLIGSGLFALRRLRSTSPGAAHMLLFGMLGMLAGLMLDLRGARLELVTSLCGGSAAAGFPQVLFLHWNSLPAMHIGMLSGGLVALPFARFRWFARRRMRSPWAVDIARHAVCAVCMFAGMSVGALACQRLAALLAVSAAPSRGAVVMLAGMFAGMVWGMVLHAALHRTCASLRHLSILPTEIRHGQQRPLRS